MLLSPKRRYTFSASSTSDYRPSLLPREKATSHLVILVWTWSPTFDPPLYYERVTDRFFLGRQFHANENEIENILALNGMKSVEILGVRFRKPDQQAVEIS